MTMTDHSGSARGPLFTAPFFARLAACCLALAILAAVAGCSGGQAAGSGTGSAEESGPVGARMAGAVVDVNVTPEAIAAKPRPWTLTTPESAVRSYLDWTSYAYRTAQSPSAKATMSSSEDVRVDSYIQYNIQKGRLIDQTLKSIAFGKPDTGGSRSILPAKEEWTYRYVSIETAGKTIEGPYEVSYDTTYTVVKTGKDGWVVDSVEVKALDKVK